MNDSASPRNLGDTWELPGFDLAQYVQKKHKYALVIPVINEGERIQQQLQQIYRKQFQVDVIIADGGSTDGSLDAGYMHEVGVTAVLTKTGPGKLSAQLRMAYAWCIRQGYQGIITIDGNGKDGVDAIVDMVKKLEEGYDYIQGARYLAGGVAENTPFERTVANRLIHAPLLSLAGRHWFVDTTNGFRAYSVRYLLDPRVQPFRDIFQRYELLFYLTVRAGQIGMKVCQLPVTRSYPPNGKIPTKIEGINSKLMVLGETLSAATGAFTPDSSKPSQQGWIWFAVITLFIIFPLFMAFLISPNYSNDSWAYYELGQTVFAEFYSFSHFRTYWTSSPYATWFPPLFPVAIAVMDAIFSAGARSGFYLGFLSFMFFAMVSEHVARRIFRVAWLGLAMALILLPGPDMILDEMTAGRTIPLQLLFFAVILAFLVDYKERKSAHALALGIVCGLAVLNRFDAIFLPPLVASALWFLTRRLAPSLVVLLSAILVISPWIIFSFKNFGTLFVTDNTHVATAIDRLAFASDWWPNRQTTVFDDPVAWLKKIILNSIDFAKAVLSAGLSRMGLVFILALMILAGVQYLTLRDRKHICFRGRSSEEVKILAVFSAIMFCLLMPQMLTGYFDARYFTPFFWSIFLLASGWLVQRGRNIQQRQAFAKLVFVLVATVVSAFSGISFLMSAYSGRLDLSKWSVFENPSDVFALNECMRGYRNARILVLGNNRLAARAGALTGLKTMMEPRNMASGRLQAEGSRAFLSAWNVRFVFVAIPEKIDFALSTFKLEEVRDCQLKLFMVVK